MLQPCRAPMQLLWAKNPAKRGKGGGPNLIPPPAASPPALRPPWEAPQGLRVPSCTGEEVASEPFILEKVQACRYSNTIYKKIKFFTVLKVARGYGDCASNGGQATGIPLIPSEHPPTPKGPRPGPKGGHDRPRSPFSPFPGHGTDPALPTTLPSGSLPDPDQRSPGKMG